MAEYILLKSSVGGSAFWKKILYAIKDCKGIKRLKLSQRTGIYLVPASCIDVEKLPYDVSYLKLSVEDLGKDLKWDAEDIEIRIETRKVKGYWWDFDVRIIHVKVRSKDGEREYVVYPNRRIREYLEEGSEDSSTPEAMQHG